MHFTEGLCSVPKKVQVRMAHTTAHYRPNPLALDFLGGLCFLLLGSASRSNSLHSTRCSSEGGRPQSQGLPARMCELQEHLPAIHHSS
jgi:hypothetical protein